MRRFLLSVIFQLLTISLMASEIHVSAAASLTDVMTEIALAYNEAGGSAVVYNFAASNVLARQIQEGAPVDIFFSADEEKMDSLSKKNLILPETRKSLLSNALVIVVPVDSNLKLDSPQSLATGSWKIAIAEPQTVPAGIYAKKYLQKAGLWSRVIDRLIPTENVRAALSTVESGNVDAGIVYKTDAFISQRVKIAYEIPASETPDISYVVAVIRESENVEVAKHFVSYLSSSESLEKFKKYGFITR